MNDGDGNLLEKSEKEQTLEPDGPQTETGESLTPKSFRGKVVYFIWRTIPRLFLIGMIALIVLLFGSINEKKAAMEKAKADAKPPELPLINTVVMPLVPGTMKDRINLPGALSPGPPWR